MKTLGLPALRLVGTLAAALMLGLAPLSSFAQDAATPAPAVTPETVVATVGGEPITEADISFAAEDLRQQLQQVPPAEQKALLLNVLIETKIIAKAARDAQMADSAMFKLRQKYLTDRELRRAYFDASVSKPLPDGAVQKAYDEYLATLTDGEVHARHILVATEEEAKAIKAELDGGKDFAELAKEKSTDPSAQQNGGDLGFFSRQEMVKPFADAAFSMDVGAISDPVKSDFGWHIIKVEEKRPSTPAALADVTPQIEQHLHFQAYEAEVNALKQGVAVDIPDPALAEAVKRQAAQAEAQ
jgi:peptidyl-prolyl cis-trans isomerase C